MKKDLAYYISLPHPITVIPCEEGGFFAEIPLLRGCVTQGDDWEELGKMVQEAKELWLEVALEEGYDIPEPEDEP